MLHHFRTENHKIKQPIMCSQVRKILKKLNIESIARSSEFVKRKAKKITPENFILSFLCVFIKSNFSFRQWACQLSFIINEQVSFQIISKRCSTKCLKFVEMTLEKAISEQLKALVPKNKFKNQFGRILLEDSTCFYLSRSMLKAFSGAGNANSNVAMCKSHFCYDLLTMSALSFKMTQINENDASHSYHILDHLKPDDLVLRDMGYLSIKVLHEISQKDAYYISRLKDNYKYYLPNTDTEFDLGKELKRLNNIGQKTFKKELTIGKQKHLSAIIIAVKLTEEQVQKRKKRYQKKQGINKVMSETKKQLLGWSVFVTNIEEEKIDIEQMFALYSLRWQIELMFKTWKSRFGINTILKNYTGNDSNKILILFYLSLLFCVAVYKPMYIKYQQLIHKKYSKTLSPHKFACVITNYLDKMGTESEFFLKLLTKNACFDNRNNRINHFDVINSIGT